MDLDVGTVDRLLTTTRAVRKRLDLTRPVPPDVITECVRLATQAPSAADAQNWRWVVITEPGLRKEIADIRRADDLAFIQAKVAGLGPGPERRRMESALYLLEHLHEVPVLVLPYVLDLDLDGLEGQPVPPALLYGSIFPAVWSFQLALRSRGLGTTPLAAPDERAIAQVIGAPEDAHLSAFLPVAYYIGESFRPAARRPVDEVLAWDGWT
jgi:nitroreductase